LPSFKTVTPCCSRNPRIIVAVSCSSLLKDWVETSLFSNSTASLLSASKSSIAIQIIASRYSDLLHGNWKLYQCRCKYFNKHWNTLQKHPKLLWQLLCLCSHDSKKIFFHQWIGFKQKKGDTKRLKFLLEIYPNRKQDELEMLSTIMTLKELKELAINHGYSDKELEKLF
jgi:hypothetical protein